MKPRRPGSPSFWEAGSRCLCSDTPQYTKLITNTRSKNLRDLIRGTGVQTKQAYQRRRVESPYFAKMGGVGWGGVGTLPHLLSKFSSCSSSYSVSLAASMSASHSSMTFLMSMIRFRLRWYCRSVCFSTNDFNHGCIGADYTQPHPRTPLHHSPTREKTITL